MKVRKALTKKTDWMNWALPALGLLGVGVIWLSTYRGTGVGGDATIYLYSARNFIEGRGLGLIGPRGEFRLLPYFPPFYPLVLSGLGLLGFDLLAAAHWLNMILFGALVWLSGHVVYRARRSPFFGLLAALLTLASPVLIPIYSWAMSEPLCLLLGFGGLALLPSAARKPERALVFYGSALLAGLSLLTRYSALAFVAIGAAALLLFGRRKWPARLLYAGRYAFAALLPMLIWLVYDLGHTATVASRRVETMQEMAWRFSNLWPSLEEVILFWFVPNSWVFEPRYPEVLNHALMVALLLFFAGWGAWLFRRAGGLQADDGRRLAALLALFWLGYAALIGVVYITTFPPITLAHRMLSPMHVAFLWLAVLLASFTFDQAAARTWLRRGIILGLALFTAWYGWRSVRILEQNYEIGMGYTSPAWRSSETIEAVQKLPAGTLIITNEQNAVLFLTDRPAYPMAEIYRVEPLSVFFAFGQGDIASDETQRLFREEGAALVLFDSIHRQFRELYGERTEERVAALTRGLDQAFAAADGAVYFYPGRQPSEQP